MKVIRTLFPKDIPTNTWEYLHLWYGFFHISLSRSASPHMPLLLWFLCGAALLMSDVLRCVAESGNWHLLAQDGLIHVSSESESIQLGWWWAVCWRVLVGFLRSISLWKDRQKPATAKPPLGLTLRGYIGYILNSADPSATWRNVGNGWKWMDDIGWKVSKERRHSMPSTP